MGRQMNTDIEGPVTKDDNAFGYTSHIIPAGDKVFSNISKYDDVLGENFQREGYNVGDTLRLVLPLLRAHGATDKGMEAYARKNITIVPGVKEALSVPLKNMKSFAKRIKVCIRNS